jgi:predicted CoA-substrate-specific enzyme activase
MTAERTSLGICIGASSIKVVELTKSDDRVEVGRTEVIRHDCNTRDCLMTVLDRYPPQSFDHVCVTGRKFKDLVNLPTVTEPEAVEQALGFALKRDATRYNGLLSLGSENFILYQLNEEGAMVGVRAGNKCASGTGEFFLQQIGRMNIDVEAASELAQGAEPFKVSGRCSVFCKSDCTHALNKGVPGERVVAGLGNMIAEKGLEILGSTPRQNVLAVGGVTKNQYVMRQLRGYIDNLVIPEHADVFEALGAALCAFQQESITPEHVELVPQGSSFATLPPLSKSADLVTFQDVQRETAEKGDETILGLDVGSTTTKAVLLRTRDNAVLASIYLRTNGNPIRASRECYQAIVEQLGETKVSVIGLGATGSGRVISGLHAQTDGVINEIIAHATAAAYFDKDVDTILEIGGQDAKYTHLVNGVPCDYAMNEACSAGTGSFIEEAAKESLDVDVLDIQDIAMKADAPPNFNDQCAAFISSDIKNASHEISTDNIVAGLVYSICMNYCNRVKGPRKVGNKIFMQGGVCYNKAVPLAMASLLKKPIIVPPEPGLMGAFGVALEIKQRMGLGLLDAGSFDLAELAAREVSYGKSFTCPGTKEKCDRGCNVNVIKIKDRKYPFGGVCNKYYNAAHHLEIDPRPFDLVARRQDALYGRNGHKRQLAAELGGTSVSAANRVDDETKTRKSIGLSRSFFVNSLYPLYHRFFSELGLEVIVSDTVDPEGIARTYSSFCFPAEISHGMLMDLVKKNPDYLFLPRVYEMSVENPRSVEPGHQCTCITAFGEAYYLKSAFKDIRSEIVEPLLNFSKGWDSQEKAFADIGEQLGCTREAAREAYHLGVKDLKNFIAYRKSIGTAALEEIEKDPNSVGVVLFGRPYNAFADEANMGIPRKFASRGVHVIPFDCLSYAHEPTIENMTWAMGQEIIRAAHLVKKHPQLFGTFVTNFGCGPDSFVVGYFRDIMKTKPSLTLEIDNHTADAGLNTRVEAFLDIVDRYRKVGVDDPVEKPIRKAELVFRRGQPRYIASDGSETDLSDPRVKVLFPSMGRTITELASAAFAGFGIRSEAVATPSYRTLMAGRANTNCKECLPLILTVGSMLEYIEDRRDKDELLLYFMPTSNGNCRFPQYYVFFNKLIDKHRMENVVTYTLTSENSYGGMGMWRVLTLVKAIIIGDIMDDIRNAMLVLAEDRDQALAAFDEAWKDLRECFANGAKNLYKVLGRVADRLVEVPKKYPIEDAKKVLMAGEIYVRKDEFSSQRVVEAMAKKDIVVQRAPMIEWIHYVDYWVQYVEKRRLSLGEWVELKARMFVMNRVEKKIKKILAGSGFYQYEVCDIGAVLDVGEQFVDRYFGGETILVIGRFFKDMMKDFHGMVSIGPFACLPTRIIEAILTPESKIKGNGRIEGLPGMEHLKAATSLPFLSIESDGNPFPQIIEAQMEAFCLQVERLFQKTQGDVTLKV